MISHIWEGRNIPAYQISARSLNPRLKYYYFRFLKTNVRHAGILPPVPISTFASPSTCYTASEYQISSKSDHPRRSYDVISIFQDGGHGIAILLTVSAFVTHLGSSKSKCVPFFGQISQSTAEILLLPVSKNKRPSFWNSTSGSNFYVCVTIGMSSGICLLNISESPNRIEMQFCIGVDICDVVTPANFGSYRFRRFRMAGV